MNEVCCTEYPKLFRLCRFTVHNSNSISISQVNDNRYLITLNHCSELHESSNCTKRHKCVKLLERLKRTARSCCNPRPESIIRYRFQTCRERKLYLRKLQQSWLGRVLFVLCVVEFLYTNHLLFCDERRWRHLRGVQVHILSVVDMQQHSESWKHETRNKFEQVILF